MKLFKQIFFIALIIATTFNANAAFVVKQNAPMQTEQVATSVETASIENNIITKKQTKLQKMVTKRLEKKMAKGGSAEIEKILYIILAILGLGWLGMGLNDNFEGTDWIIALALSAGMYIGWWFLGPLVGIFYLAQLIYTLYKMKKYY